MIYPVNYIAITQYPHKNSKAIDFGWCGHHNQDILSVDDGVVYRIEKQNLGGNVIIIKHNTGIVSSYGHLKSINVKKGQKVKLGQVIGKMGATGKGVTGEHLHFQLAKKGSNIYKANLDPFKFLQVYKGQNVAKSGNTLKYKDKIMYAPDDLSFTKNSNYRLLVKKAIRKTPKIVNNIIGYCDVGKDIYATEIIKEKNNRIWGKTKKGYLVLENKDGTKQCFKL